jgi:hypothetical protein
VKTEQLEIMEQIIILLLKNCHVSVIATSIHSRQSLKLASDKMDWIAGIKRNRISLVPRPRSRAGRICFGSARAGGRRQD